MSGQGQVTGAVPPRFSMPGRTSVVGLRLLISGAVAILLGRAKYLELDVGLPRGLHTSVGSPTPSSKRFGKFRQVRVVARHRHVLRRQAEAVLHPPVEYHLPSACV